MQGYDVRMACEAKATTIAVSASAQSGIDYGIDSMQGLTRIHTRVSTQTAADYFRERSYNALAIACSTAGGNASYARGYRSLASAHSRAMRKHNRQAWKNSYSYGS